MKPLKRAFSLSCNIDSLVAAALGFFLIYLLTGHSGIGVSPDSVAYLSVARNLDSGYGLTQFDRMPMIEFPLFYSVVLWVIARIARLDPLVFTPVLNEFLFALLLYLSGSLMNVFRCRSILYKRLMLGCLLLSPCLLEVYSMMWSETLFLLCVLVFLMMVWAYLQSHSRLSLTGLCLVTAVAADTRYAGISLIATGLILIYLDPWESLKQKWRNFYVFGLSSSSLLAMNLFRNQRLTGTLTGFRQPGTTPLMRNIFFYGDTVTDWMPFPKAREWIGVATGLGLLAYLIFFGARSLVRRKEGWSMERLAILFTCVYSVFLIFSSTVTRYQQLDSRLLSPIFIPLLWSLSFWLPSRQSRLPGQAGAWILGLGVLLMLAFQYNQLKQDYETYDGVKDAGIPGYTEDPWTQGETVSFLRANPLFFQPGYSLYSNAGDAVYFASRLFCDQLPQRVVPHEMQEFFSDNEFYLIWFNDIQNPDMIGLHEILEKKKMNCLKQFEDGAIYICP